MSTWPEQVPTSGSIELPPDPRALDGLGRNHSLATALADIVDNSIDANASHVLIRFIRRTGRLHGLYVVDNGHGMGTSAIDTAMTVGGRRVYGANDLGRFGIGMKAASFSQARSLTVISKTSAAMAVGRRWELDGDRRGFHCDIVPTDFCADEFDRGWGIPDAGTGTVIRWDNITGFPLTDDPIRVEKFISQTVSETRNHLGLVFHRILEAGRVHVSMDVEDVDINVPGPRFDVEALNPFGYLRSSNSAYPKELVAVSSTGVKISFVCHLWPGRSKLPQFTLSGDPAERQGLYFYRNDRLLQAGGGWDGVHTPDKTLQLARVAIDINDDIVGLFRMNPEKSRVLVGPEFGALVEQARAEDASDFTQYFTDAEQAYRESRQRNRKRTPMFPPGKGFTPMLRGAIEGEVPILEREEPLNIKWRRFDDDSMFEVDKQARTLWLNQAYRPNSVGERRSVNDAPLLKALLYLLMENLFHGERTGPGDKDNIQLWQEILTAAARSGQ
ncbi:ATP-binding protein [Sphaerisporangium dianthi]|uniref:ATP-binding protein n=1 Tax=Sphaerisporangium dianthi TaxID=1436120 RepID=A0ABV9CQ37_9ACTN